MECKRKNLRKVFEWLFYVFIFLLPCQARYIFSWGEMNGRWEFGDISLYGVDILLGVILVLALILHVNCQALKNHASVIMTWWVVAFFELVIFISIFWAADMGLAFYGWLRILAGIALFWLAMHFGIRKTNIIYALVLSGIAQGILGIYQFFAQHVFASKWLGMAEHIVSTKGTSVVEVLDQRWLRAYGSLPHPNALAGFLVVCFVFLLWISMSLKNGRQKILVLVGLVTILPALFFTFSRGAWIALGLSVLYLVGSTFAHRKNLTVNWKMLGQVLVLAIIIVALLSFAYSDLLSARLAGTERLEIKSSIERVGTFDQAFILMDQTFPLGTGINNYSLALHNLINENLISWSYQPVHNVYLLVLAEVGLFGFVLWFGIIMMVIWKRVGLDGARLQVFRAVLLAVLIMMLFDHYFWTLGFGIYLFWLILALKLAKRRV